MIRNSSTTYGRVAKWLHWLTAQWERPFGCFHYQIAAPFLLWILVAAHAATALYHHYVEKDDVLIPMLPNNLQTNSNNKEI